MPDLGNLSAKSYPRRGRWGSRPRPLSRKEVRKIVDGADNPQDALSVALLYFCGLRLCELEGMKRGQVTTKERLIEVPGKCSCPRFRRVPYPRELDQLLEQYLERRSDWGNDALEVAKKLKHGRRVLFLFPSRRGGYLSTSAIRKIVLRAAEKGGRSGGSPRETGRSPGVEGDPSALRRAFKAHAVGDGIPREHVYIIMGYEKPSFHNLLLGVNEEAAIRSYRENFGGLGEEAAEGLGGRRGRRSTGPFVRRESSWELRRERWVKAASAAQAFQGAPGPSRLRGQERGRVPGTQENSDGSPGHGLERLTARHGRKKGESTPLPGFSCGRFSRCTSQALFNSLFSLSVFFDRFFGVHSCALEGFRYRLLQPLELVPDGLPAELQPGVLKSEFLDPCGEEVVVLAPPRTCPMKNS